MDHPVLDHLMHLLLPAEHRSVSWQLIGRLVAGQVVCQVNCVSCLDGQVFSRFLGRSVDLSVEWLIRETRDTETVREED